jgi:hypothetical protein
VKSVLCGGLFALLLGCQPPEQVRPFDASKAIETEKGYRQDGISIDSKDLWTKLEVDPDTGPHVRRSRTLDIISTVMIAPTGIMIGLPVGEAIGGDPDPLWELAVVGGVLFVAAIPLAAWGASSRTKAITVHNAGVGQAFYRLPASPWIVGKDSVGFVF